MTRSSIRYVCSMDTCHQLDLPNTLLHVAMAGYKSFLLQFLVTFIPKKLWLYKRRTNSASCIIQLQNKITSGVDPIVYSGSDHTFFSSLKQAQCVAGEGAVHTYYSLHTSFPQTVLMMYSDEGRKALLRVLELTFYTLELTPKWSECPTHPRGCAWWQVDSRRIFEKENPRWQRSKWKLHWPLPRTNLELQPNCREIILNNQLNTSWTEAYNYGQTEENTSPQCDWEGVRRRHRGLAGLPQMAAEVPKGYFSGRGDPLEKCGV